VDELTYYATPGPMTGLPHGAALAGLPSDIADITATLQGLMMHKNAAPQLGVAITDERRAEEQLRSAPAIVEGILALDPVPLREQRPPERRLIVNCRHFAVLACALMRSAGRPARARAGFSTYHQSGCCGDHWIIEHWQDGRWVRSDPDLPPGFLPDPLDIPPGRFITGAAAWLLCRTGVADPERFGVEDWNGAWKGAWFVRNNVLRDLAALNKVELLPWDSWGLMDRQSGLGEGSADALVDRVAEAVEAGDWTAFRRLYQQDDGLRVPDLPTDGSQRSSAPAPDRLPDGDVHARCHAAAGRT
jgi:Transglutaminase-like superfamily